MRLPPHSGASPKRHVPRGLSLRNSEEPLPRRRERRGPSPAAAAGRGGSRRRSPLPTPGVRGAALPAAERPRGWGFAAPRRRSSRPRPGPVPARGSPGALGPAGGPAPALPGRRAKQSGDGEGREKGEKVRLLPPPGPPPGSPCVRQRCQRILTGGRGWREGEEEDGGREGRRDEREPLSFPGLFFQFPVSHCAHSGYVLRLQVCPLLAAFPRLPGVGSGCRGVAADRDRHVMINFSRGGFCLSSPLSLSAFPSLAPRRSPPSSRRWPQLLPPSP